MFRNESLQHQGLSAYSVSDRRNEVDVAGTRRMYRWSHRSGKESPSSWHIHWLQHRGCLDQRSTSKSMLGVACQSTY